MLPNQNENHSKCIFKHCCVLTLHIWMCFIFWLTSANTHQWLDDIIHKGQLVHPKMLSSHTLDSFCQEPKVPSIPYAFHSFAGSCPWLSQRCFWQADAFQIATHYDPKCQIAWTAESDLVGKLNGNPRITRCFHNVTILKHICHFITVFPEAWKYKDFSVDYSDYNQPHFWLIWLKLWNKHMLLMEKSNLLLCLLQGSKCWN